MPTAIVGLEAAGHQLVLFDSATPGTTSTVPIGLLSANQDIVGIDYRPADGLLYGLAYDGIDAQLYTINATTGVATPGAILTADPTDTTNKYTSFPTGGKFGIDFDPQNDVLRIVTSFGGNFQVNPANGQVTTDDDIAGDTSALDAIAFTNNIKGAPSTTMFGIDSFFDQAYTISSPTAGITSATPSPLGVDTDENIGFDISANRGFATLTIGTTTSLYTIEVSTGAAANSNTGRATLVGQIGSTPTLLSDLAIVLDTAAPVVSSITKADVDPTRAPSVRFFVDFSESVSGVDAGDFQVIPSKGLSGGSVTNVVYDDSIHRATVTVSSYTGTGTVALNLVDNDSIVDSSGNPLGGTGAGNGDFSGPNYTITAGPGATINQATGQSDPSQIQPVHFTVTFSEKVIGFANPDITIGGTAGATTAVVTTTDSISYDVAVSGATQAGTITISFPAGAAQAASDNADNVTPTVIDDSVTIKANTAPSISAPDNVTIQQNTNLVFTGANKITISDADAGDQDVQLRINTTNGTVTLASTTGLTFVSGANNTASMTVTGKLADINSALSGSFFQPTSNFTGSARVDLDANDLGHNGAGSALNATATVHITVNNSTSPNQAPTITAPSSIRTDKNTPFAFTGSNSISISDADAGTGQIKVSLAVSHGTLTLSNTGNLTFTTGDGTTDASMTFTGSLADVNNALSAPKYTPATDYTGSDTFTINVDDQGNTGTGGSQTASKGVAITVGPNPVANNDSFSTKQNQTLTITAPGVLANDTSPSGKSLTAKIATNVDPRSGTVTLNDNGSFTFTPATNFVGTATFTYTASDGTLTSNPATVTITVSETFTRLHATGAGPGGAPHVIVYNEDGSVRFSFDAFDPAFAGGVSVATGDVNGDGVEDIIVGAGPGGGPQVRVLSGVDLAQIHSFMAYNRDWTGGVNVAAGDVNGDGRTDIITGAGPGAGSHVRVFNGVNGRVIQEFMAFDANFLGGVSVAAGDLDGDGKADIVVGAGPGGAPHVIVFKGGTSEKMQSFLAFDAAFPGGVNVAVGEFNNKAAIFTAAGPGGVPVVQVWDFKSNKPVSAFFAFGMGETTGDAAITGGVHIGTEVAVDGTTVLFLGAGKGEAPLFRALDASTLQEKASFNAYDPAFLGGVFVG